MSQRLSDGLLTMDGCIFKDWALDRQSEFPCSDDRDAKSSGVIYRFLHKHRCSHNYKTYSKEVGPVGVDCVQVPLFHEIVAGNPGNMKVS